MSARWQRWVRKMSMVAGIYGEAGCMRGDGGAVGFRFLHSEYKHVPC